MRKIPISFLFILFSLFNINQEIKSNEILIPDSADIIVAKDGSGQFTTVQEAINAVPDFRKNKTIIYIKNGIYTEKVTVPPTKQSIILVGEDVFKTIIAYSDWAQKQNAFGENIGTSGSASVFVYGNDFYATNITFQNTAGPVGQAVAVWVGAEKAIFYNCRFLGNQDTLYTHSENSRQYYKNCYIEGTTDFIFGWSTAVFEECEIHCLKDSYITAASTSPNSEYGYLFYKCKITAEPEVSKVYLGRPWRNTAKTVYRECELGSFILPQGWHNWSKPEAEKTAFYAEYKNSGPGAKTAERVKWSKQLTDKQAEEWTVENVLKGNDNWIPEIYKIKK